MVDDTLTAKYLRGIGLIAADFGTARSYYLYNAHGDVTGLTNAIGTVTQKYDYDAFGNEQPLADYPTENDQNPFRYCGEYLDAETGTYYLRARYYNLITGRFTQEDPVKDGRNWYVYCANNPLMFGDPSGLALVNIVDYANAMGASTNIYQKNGKNYVSVHNKNTTQNYTYYNSGTIDDIVLNERFGWNSFLTDRDRHADVGIYINDGTLYRDVTKPIDDALGKTITEAQQYARSAVNAGLGFRGGATMGMIISSVWFYKQVNHNAPWDIKRKDPWESTVGSTFPGQYDALIYYEEGLTTPEELGNYTYGYIGGATGFNLEMLYAGSWYAAGMPLGDAAWTNEFNDWNAIKKGYDAYHGIS